MKRSPPPAGLRLAPVCLALCLAACSSPYPSGYAEPLRGVAQAVSGPFSWQGYTLKPTTGGMAGVAPGDAANVSVDADGYLHLKVTDASGSWTASEVFTSESLGFGTYQWQIEGAVDQMDHHIVLGLYPYGPAGGIGTDGFNEIDTEFSYWNDEVTNVNFDWAIYPANSAGTKYAKELMFSLGGGNAATARMEWSSTGIKGTLMSGYQPIGSTADVLATMDDEPTDPTDNIPQQAMPLGMNLWCYHGTPSAGNGAEVVIRQFQFVPEGQPIPGDDGGSDSASGADAGTDAPADASAATDAADDAEQMDAGGGDDGGADSATVSDAAGGDDGGVTTTDSGTGRAEAGVPEGGSFDAGTPRSGDAGGNGEMGDSGGVTNLMGDNSTDGCSCRVAGAREGSPVLAWLLPAFVGAAGLRRRRGNQRARRGRQGMPQTSWHQARSQDRRA